MNGNETCLILTDSCCTTAQGPAVHMPQPRVSPCVPGANTPAPATLGSTAGEHLPAHLVPRGVSVDCPAKWMNKGVIKDNSFKMHETEAGTSPGH